MMTIYEKIKNGHKQKIAKKCCECGSFITYVYEKDPYYREHWHKHRCGKADCSRYLCKKCYTKGYQKNNPNSQRNLRKDLANIRTGNSNIYDNTYKGLIGELIVCKYFNIKNRNKTTISCLK